MTDNKTEVFLGGACGSTTWRGRIAIPALEAAGVSYYNPQLGPGEWTPARLTEETEAKANSAVLLFVINAESRGVASLAEAAFFLGRGRPIALVVSDIGEADSIDGERLGAAERKDLNRGRIFVRSMAQEAGVDVFADVESAVEQAIRLARAARKAG